MADVLLNARMAVPFLSAERAASRTETIAAGRVAETPQKKLLNTQPDRLFT
jgi:hypothetical protein